MKSCPCGSKLEYPECCDQIHSGERKPQTALELMKARYSAFVKNQIDFVDNTHIPGTVDFNKEEAAEWAVSSIWKRLEIVKTEAGEVDDDKGMVEFKAYYDDKKGNQYIHHEIAQFEKKDGDWFYSEGEIPETTPFTRATPKVGRNEPCPCGSEKKFKKCCGA